jgi:hypothetical protein
MSGSNQRLTAWQIKIDTGRMKQTLNAAGAHTIMYVPYLSYARQLYKLSCQQSISGESFGAWGPGPAR